MIGDTQFLNYMDHILIGYVIKLKKDRYYSCDCKNSVVLKNASCLKLKDVRHVLKQLRGKKCNYLGVAPLYKTTKKILWKHY